MELRGAGPLVTARVVLLKTVRDGDRTVRDGDRFGFGAIASGARARLGPVFLHVACGAYPALTGAGLVLRGEPVGGPARFGARAGGDHHVVCHRAVSPDLVRRPRFRHRRGRGHPLGPAPRLFHHPQFLSTVIRQVRKDSHV